MTRKSLVEENPPRRRARSERTLTHVWIHLEHLMETIQSLTTKLDTLGSTVAAIKAELDALKNQPPGVATQADLDGLGAKIDTIQASVTA